MLFSCDFLVVLSARDLFFPAAFHWQDSLRSQIQALEHQLAVALAGGRYVNARLSTCLAACLTTLPCTLTSRSGQDTSSAPAALREFQRQLTSVQRKNTEYRSRLGRLKAQLEKEQLIAKSLSAALESERYGGSTAVGAGAIIFCCDCGAATWRCFFVCLWLLSRGGAGVPYVGALGRAAHLLGSNVCFLDFGLLTLGVGMCV